LRFDEKQQTSVPFLSAVFSECTQYILSFRTSTKCKKMNSYICRDFDSGAGVSKGVRPPFTPIPLQAAKLPKSSSKIFEI